MKHKPTTIIKIVTDVIYLILGYLLVLGAVLLAFRSIDANEMETEFYRIEYNN
jgi:hypothetical protein